MLWNKPDPEREKEIEYAVRGCYFTFLGILVVVVILSLIVAIAVVGKYP